MLTLILLTFLTNSFGSQTHSSCPVQINLGVERTIVTERPTPEYTGYDMCVTLDAADVCYTGSFSGTFKWNLSIIISEQPNLRLPVKLPKFPKTGHLKSNTCMKIKKPQICFENYNPFVASDELELELTTESISFNRIETSSSMLRKIGRYFQSEKYGIHHGNVNGQLCLSWVSNESSTFYGKKWHSAFQYTKDAEVPYNFGDGLILYNSSVNNMETCIPIKEKMTSIFSEHAEDVTLWELSKPLTFSVTHVPKSLKKNEYEGYVDGNSRNVDYDTATCFTNVKTNVCMVNPENAVQNMATSINVNAQGAKPWEGSAPGNEPNVCIPSTINKLCLNLEDVILTNDANSLEKQEPHVTNTMYFVSSDKVRNKSNKFFCKKMDEANFCINSKTSTFYDNNLISSIQFHPLGLSPRVNASSGKPIYDDIHKCLKSCAFDACFTSNDNGLPWILASTMYFTKM